MGQTRAVRWLGPSLLVFVAACPNSAADLSADSSTVAAASSARIVSLSPGITETIAALGGADRIIGVSSFCRRPPEICDKPAVGHALRPDLEGIARLQPDLIIFEATETGPGTDLERLAPTTVLPWLTLDDITGSVRRLGPLIGRSPAAETLARRLLASLGRASDPNGPEVLLLLGYPEPSGTFWFMKPESLHGRLVNAVGGRPPRALAGWRGPPKMTAEDLVRLDPEWIVILSRDRPSGSTAGIDRLSTLSAVRAGRVRTLIDPDIFSTGPTILTFVEPLAARLKESTAP